MNATATAEAMSRSDIYHPRFDDSTHARLINWARVVRDSGGSPAHCNSIEGMYDRRNDPDIARPDDDLQRQRRASIEPDTSDAWMVDKVLRGPTFPKLEHDLIVSHYLFRIRPEKACRVLAIRWKDYDARVTMAVLVVRNRLAIFEREFHRT